MSNDLAAYRTCLQIYTRVRRRNPSMNENRCPKTVPYPVYRMGIGSKHMEFSCQKKSNVDECLRINLLKASTAGLTHRKISD